MPSSLLLMGPMKDGSFIFGFIDSQELAPFLFVIFFDVFYQAFYLSNCMGSSVELLINLMASCFTTYSWNHFHNCSRCFKYFWFLLCKDLLAKVLLFQHLWILYDFEWDKEIHCWNCHFLIEFKFFDLQLNCSPAEMIFITNNCPIKLMNLL